PPPPPGSLRPIRGFVLAFVQIDLVPRGAARVCWPDGRGHNSARPVEQGAEDSVCEVVMLPESCSDRLHFYDFRCADDLVRKLHDRMPAIIDAKGSCTMV